MEQLILLNDVNERKYFQALKEQYRHDQRGMESECLF